MRVILSHCQRVVNARLRSVLDTVTLETHPRQQIYSFSLLPTVLRVEAVRENGRDLAAARWQALGHVRREWFRRLGARFEVFSRMGRGQLVIHPAKDEMSSVSVIGTKITATLDDPTDELELEDQDLVPVMDLMEAIMLIRERRYNSLKEVMTRLTTNLGFPNVKEQRPESRK